MILSVLSLLIVSLLLLVFFFLKKIMYPLSLKIAGLILIFFVLIQYIIKISMYNSGLIGDYALYVHLFKIKLSISDLAVMNNIGMFILMASTILFLKVSSKLKNIFSILLLIPLVLFLIINEPRVGEKLYLYGIKRNNGVELISNLLQIVNFVILAVYMSLPYLSLFRVYRNTMLYSSKNESIISCIIWGTLDIVVISLLFVSDLKHYFIFNLDLFKYPKTVLRVESNNIIVFLMPVLFIITAFLVSHYTPFGKISLRNRKLRLTNEVSQSVSMMLHTYKNAFSSIAMFADERNNSFLNSEIQRLKIVNDIAIEQVERIKKIINIYNSSKTIHANKSEINIIDCIEETLSKMGGSNNINIIKMYSDKPVMLNADEYQICESLLCLINNSIEAVLNVEKPAIKINAGIEMNKVYIEIEDNGCGIAKKNINFVFNSFYSSKKGGANFGMGLTYVKKMIEAHNGSIVIKSKLNEYTKIQVVLPV